MGCKTIMPVSDLLRCGDKVALRRVTIITHKPESGLIYMIIKHGCREWMGCQLTCPGTSPPATGINKIIYPFSDDKSGSHSTSMAEKTRGEGLIKKDSYFCGICVPFCRRTSETQRNNFNAHQQTYLFIFYIYIQVFLIDGIQTRNLPIASTAC